MKKIGCFLAVAFVLAFFSFASAEEMGVSTKSFELECGSDNLIQDLGNGFTLIVDTSENDSEVCGSYKVFKSEYILIEGRIPKDDPRSSVSINEYIWVTFQPSEDGRRVLVKW
ncbi:MAG: hypothetical protein PHH24_00900 [Candidatus Moranbacteria bacterium]|nr:hypothetical protein [Candidatus Moranbacteria bacterium]MDD5652424.1 hypothetical protein [Candidatus Moranbacteria bacterium]MDX9855815.1 hypothetical protein [Candidatus Moranbacteria bacterium]